MLNHGIEFDVQECTLKRDVVRRLATIHFVANIIQLIYTHIYDVFYGRKENVIILKNR